MFVSQVLKWIVPLVKPGDVIEPPRQLEEDKVLDCQLPSKLITTPNKSETHSTCSAGRETSVMSVCWKSKDRAAENVSDVGDSLKYPKSLVSYNGKVSLFDEFNPKSTDDLCPSLMKTPKENETLQKPACPLISDADFISTSSPVWNDVESMIVDGGLNRENAVCAVTQSMENELASFQPTVPKVSEADSANVSDVGISLDPQPAIQNPRSSASPKLSPLCKKILEVKQRKANRKSIYTQTDKNQERRHFTHDRPALVKNSSEQNDSIQFSTAVESKPCLSLEKFVCMTKPVFREYVNTKRVVPNENVYGELLVFGCNGFPPSHLASQIQSKFILRKRLKANGVKEAFSYVTSGGSPRCPSRHNLTVSYNVSANRSVVVEYVRDKSTDMFQIGRYDSSPVDFRVLDVNTGQRARNGVSRFACRIVVERHGDHIARVYAAAFDSTGNVFLGEGALTCVREGKMDGFTTNGVLLMHPDPKHQVWREVSVCGYIYPLRSPNVQPKKRPRLSEETNILQDGTLIDLCGVTLLWRTPLGLRNTPKEDFLMKLDSVFQNMAPVYHLLQPAQKRMPYEGERKQPVVFLCCGHVIGLSDGLVSSKLLEGWSCPVCRSVGPIARLEVGREPGFFSDREFPSHAFRPCGHVTNFKTACHWSRVKVPEHRNIEAGYCPFCGTQLNSIKKYVELSVPQ